MTPIADTRRIRPARVATFAGLFVVAFALSCIVDRAVFGVVNDPGAEREDWHRLLRVMGYVPTWIVVAMALVMCDWSRAQAGTVGVYLRGLYVLGSAAAGGAAAEILKLVLRRERPSDAAAYVFRSFSDGPLSSTNLGLPSSHAAVAFAASCAMARLFPRATPVFILMALGCGFTRLLDHAHFFSDAVFGAIVGFVASWALALLGPRPALPPDQTGGTA